MLFAEHRHEKEDARSEDKCFKHEPEGGFAQKDLLHRHHNEHGVTGLFLFGLRRTGVVEVFIKELRRLRIDRCHIAVAGDAFG